jgi:hypothetical protein
MMDKYMIVDREMESTDNAQLIFRFPNDYGASVVRGPYTYGGPEGLFELAVIKFTGPGDYDWSLNYETPVTDDVIGRLEEAEVREILVKIKELSDGA